MEGRVYVVDGQQRLTTLTLILIQLRRLANELNSELIQWIGEKIAGHTGKTKKFWMNHSKHIPVLQKLFDGIDINVVGKGDTTAVNMIQNSLTIKSYLRRRLTDLHVFETFVYYFLQRLVLINLTVEQTDVPMVFEVINDRGIRLKPYEILKGKLLGQIDKDELEKDRLNELWEKHVKDANSIAEDEIDNCLRFYLKAKYADSRAEGQKFDGDYHREIFKEGLNKKLQLDHNPSGVKVFLKGDFRYFTGLYYTALQASSAFSPSTPSIYYNKLNDLDSQLHLLISVCSVDDSEQEQKLDLVSKELDRLYTLLQLQGGYDSNRFADDLYKISAKLRTASLTDIRGIFDDALVKQLNYQRSDDVTEPLRYAFFKNASIANLNKRFVRYFFARVDSFIADSIKVSMSQNFYDLVRNTGAVNGFHVEHILSRNQENLAFFNDDEELFEQQRNRLGAILLLKGQDNLSSGNEIYGDKLKSYAGTLLWNETLREDSYKSKLGFTNFVNKSGLQFKHLKNFGPDEVEERHKLLFEITKHIWA